MLVYIFNIDLKLIIPSLAARKSGFPVVVIFIYLFYSINALIIIIHTYNTECISIHSHALYNNINH